ncbi:plasmid replication protein RepC [Ruegeria halocynthiae]|uniref:plasmid replication protein RepC n=1 Tax=Ruegeria halocynthiae TaxID=985054 RepID=UPI0006920528|nr:plasmid replication protein RepC [Ruegeria halocynthiae]
MPSGEGGNHPIYRNLPPFGRRPVTAGLIEQAMTLQTAPEISHIDKWELLRDLCTARHTFEVTDRDLAVLNALVSFHPNAALSDNDSLIVFPSNAALSERAHGMAESTLRRHLAALVRAGLIARHDSPNGKRYARRDADGEIARAFGFDLRPLLHGAVQITQAAQQARADHARLVAAREKLSLLKRDALKLALYGQENDLPGDWEALLAALLIVHKQMRRKLCLEDLLDLETQTANILGDIQSLLAMKTEELIGNDSETERQYQNSKPDTPESELCPERDKGETNGNAEPDPDRPLPRVPLALILKACPDILPYCERDPREWRDLVVAASYVRGMMGISPPAWHEAQELMGPETAAVTVACILQPFGDINSPGGYLRALAGKAALGAFSPGPMVMALLNGSGRAAA